MVSQRRSRDSITIQAVNYNRRRRWIFRLNLFTTLLTTGCVIFFMPLRKVEGSWKQKLKAIDFIGIILALAGSSLLVLALTWAGGDYSWDSAHVITTLTVGALVTLAFTLWQWNGTSKPLIPFHIFKRRIVNGACLTMFINGWGFLMQIYYIPMFYQLVCQYSAVKSASLLLPITIIQTFSSTFSGMVVHWTGRYRESIIFGWIAWSIGLGLFSTLNETSGLAKQIGYAVLTGVGVGQTLQPSLIAVQSGVERRDMAVVTGTRNFVRNLGGTLGLAVSGSIVNNCVRSALVSYNLSSSAMHNALNDPQLILNSIVPGSEAVNIRGAILFGFKKGFRVVFIVGASLASFAVILAIFLMPQVDLDRPDDEKLKQEGKQRHEAMKKKKRSKDHAGTAEEALQNADEKSHG